MVDLLPLRDGGGEAAIACVKLLDDEWGGRSHGELVASSSAVDTSFAIVRREDPGTVVGHVRLRPATVDLQSNAGLVLSLVVAREQRGRGVGRAAMAAVEAEAQRRGYGYLYLSTVDQVRFYESCGFVRTEIGAGAGAVLRRVADEDVASLESMLLRRQPPRASASSGAGGGGSGGVGAAGQWLRKRLRLWTVSAVDVWAGADWRSWALVCTPRPPCVLQVGPSCGFAVLASVVFAQRGVESEPGDALDRARVSGWTTDGELLSLDPALLRVAVDVMGLADGVVAVVDCVARARDLASPSVIAYDRDPATHAPGLFGGRNAHWALVVGVVDDENVALLQPMSERISIHPWSLLLASNAQLRSISPEKCRRHGIDGDGAVHSLAGRMLSCGLRWA